MKKFFTLFFLLISVSSVFAQNGKGAINITAYPEGVTITFMGDEYKNTLERESISAGRYKVMLNKVGYVPVDTMLEVKEGITKYYNIVLNPKKSETSAVVSSVKKEEKKKSETKTNKPAKAPKAVSTDDKNNNVYALFQLVLTNGFSQSLMGGMTFKGDGFYAKVVKSVVSRPKNGNYPGGNATLDSGTQYTHAEVIGGYMHDFNNTLTGYVGAGYGKRRTFDKYTDGEYYYNEPEFKDGVAVDLGAICSFGNFAISVGLNSIQFKTFAVMAGVGLKF